MFFIYSTNTENDVYDSELHDTMKYLQLIDHNITYVGFSWVLQYMST